MKMKEAGVRDDDPEYLKAHNILTAISHQTRMQRLRQQQQQELLARQQRQIQQQQNATSTQNGANGVNGEQQKPPWRAILKAII